MGYYGYGPMGYGWGIGDLFGHLIGIAILVVILVWIVRWAFWGGAGGRMRRWQRWQMMQNMAGGNGALEILKERYAKGEINKEEFEQKKKDLE